MSANAVLLEFMLKMGSGHAGFEEWGYLGTPGKMWTLRSSALTAGVGTLDPGSSVPVRIVPTSFFLPNHDNRGVLLLSPGVLLSFLPSTSQKGHEETDLWTRLC